jgi:predicted dithiol-disulfide oxidoreductase (DUF899 family)
VLSPERRGWRHARLLSSANTTYNRDYRAETPNGDQFPLATVFARDDGSSTTAGAASSSSLRRTPGQHPRHVDVMWPVWANFDKTPDGRGTDWHPKLEYS